MLIYIPGELISLITFPGVVMHEVAHRFFCDVTNIDVYEIKYFNIWNKTAGHVIHAGTDNLLHRFLIGVGPLIINTVICMLFTLPFATKLYVGLWFYSGGWSGPLLNLGYAVVAWLGYSIGFHAIPSNQDVKGLPALAKTSAGYAFLVCFTGIIRLFNMDYVGPLFSLLYAYLISMILPTIIL